MKIDFTVGMKIQAASDSTSAGIIFEIARIGFDGQPDNVELAFPDGSKEKCVTANLYEALEFGCKVIA